MLQSQPQCCIREAFLWCAHNMKDTGLSANCQLGNYPASLPGAAEPTEPAWPSSAQQLCCWWTWLIPWNAGLSSCSSVSDFIQWGEVTRGLVIEGLHFTAETARLCAARQKSPLRKKMVKKNRGKHPSAFDSREAVLECNAFPLTPAFFSLSCLPLWEKY